MINKKMRDEALKKAARQYLAQQHLLGHTPSLRQVADAAINSPAPSFFVSYDTLYKSVCNVLKYPLKPTPSTTSAQLRALTVTARVCDLMDREKLSIADAVTRVMAQQTPCFYLSIDYALKILRSLNL